MTDPASAISRQIDRLIQMQIITLGKPSSLTQLELREYHSRSAKLKRLLAGSKLETTIAAILHVRGYASAENCDLTRIRKRAQGS